ncbi:MAG: hypothetical protein F4Y73_00140 [Gemmatimonadetes bacterium]|nr:hypothetical protein [Gemmatimonadota bacterium]
MIYVFHAALAAMAFLVTLNGFLKGAKKAQIDAILGAMVVGLLVVGFVAFGWMMGAVALILAFVYAGISRPLAAAAAARLLSSASGSPSGRYRGLPDPVLGRISRSLGRQRSPEQALDDLLHGGSSQRIDARSDLLDYCVAKPGILEVMQSFDLDRSDLEDLYFALMAVGAGQWAGGHWVAASALAYPDSLRFVAKKMGRGQAADRDETLRAVYALVMHFERGAPLAES